MTEPLSPIPGRVAVGRWGLDRYVQLVRLPAFAAGIASIVLVLFRWPQIVVVTVQLTAIVAVGLIASRRGAGRIESLTIGGLAGLAVGLMTSISRFVLTPSAYWFVNIIFETLLFGFLGAMISLGILALSHSQKKLSK